MSGFFSYPILGYEAFPRTGKLQAKILQWLKEGAQFSVSSDNFSGLFCPDWSSHSQETLSHKNREEFFENYEQYLLAHPQSLEFLAAEINKRQMICTLKVTPLEGVPFFIHGNELVLGQEIIMAADLKNTGEEIKDQWFFYLSWNPGLLKLQQDFVQEGDWEGKSLKSREYTLTAFEARIHYLPQFTPLQLWSRWQWMTQKAPLELSEGGGFFKQDFTRLKTDLLIMFPLTWYDTSSMQPSFGVGGYLQQRNFWYKIQAGNLAQRTLLEWGVSSAFRAYFAPSSSWAKEFWASYSYRLWRKNPQDIDFTRKGLSELELSFLFLQRDLHYFVGPLYILTYENLRSHSTLLPSTFQEQTVKRQDSFFGLKLGFFF